VQALPREQLGPREEQLEEESTPLAKARKFEDMLDDEAPPKTAMQGS